MQIKCFYLLPRKLMHIGSNHEATMVFGLTWWDFTVTKWVDLKIRKEKKVRYLFNYVNMLLCLRD